MSAVDGPVDATALEMVQTTPPTARGAVEAGAELGRRFV
jgi:hypothetical protein